MNKIENYPYVLISIEDFKNIVNEAAQNIAAVQVKTALPSVPEIDDQYMTREQVAALLNVSLTTLWRWNNSGILCNYKDGEAKVLYSKKEVLTFIKGRKNTGKGSTEPIEEGGVLV